MFRLRAISKFENARKMFNVGRNLCWMNETNGIYSIGITEEVINYYGNIDHIEITKEKYVKFNSEIFILETNNFIKSINAPIDIKILIKNENAINFINFDPENKDLSWIIKVKPIIWEKNYNKLFNHFIEENFGYNRNTQSIPVFNISHM